MADPNPKQIRRQRPLAVVTQTPDAEIRTPLEEEEAARKFNAALANTVGDDEWNGLGYAIASQEVLARDWLTPEDDIDWSAQIISDEE